ncbi:MAG: Glycosyl transferase group 1 [Candidatus Moranbacteria bacterium GW2011_GWF2_35_39]|nr:MAG: Glycosyl transferase group 1 [Candidatus Moranbacteria bacterium GW2011_GWF2_35_39]
MRIAFLTYNIDPRSGWGRHASDLIYEIKRLGHDVIILKEADDKLEGEAVLKRGLGLVWSALKIRKIVSGCDVVHALDAYPYGIIASLASIGLNKKIIITAVGTYAITPLSLRRMAWLMKWAYVRANHVATISAYTKERILEKLRINIKVINPGIKLNSLIRPDDDLPRDYILSVGAIKKRKGYHISIPAFAEARKNIPNLRYKIVGDQSDRKCLESLKNISKDHGIEEYVDFIQNISDEDLDKLYRRAKLFILTSVNYGDNFEGYGLVFIEAAARGLPVIGTLDNGIGDAVRDGINGILVPQKDIIKTKEAILKLLSCPDQEKIKKSSYDWALDHEINKSADEYIGMYGN